MRNHLALLLVLIPILGCDSDSPTAPDDAPLSFETIVQVSSSGFLEPQRKGIHGEDEWARVWQTLFAGQDPVPARPAVEFARESVVLAAAGSRGNGCYAIEITGARLRGDGAVELEVTETVPGPTCACTLALTQPAHLVRIERVLGAESFIDRQVELPC